jgi:hypothetical protein
LYVAHLIEESKLVGRQTGAALGEESRLAAKVVADYYQKKGYPHTEWTYLRKHQPVAYVKHPRTDPVWAVTKAADIMEISKPPRLWLNGPRLAVFLLEEGEQALPPEALPLKHLLNMVRRSTPSTGPS